MHEWIVVFTRSSVGGKHKIIVKGESESVARTNAEIALGKESDSCIIDSITKK